MKFLLLVIYLFTTVQVFSQNDLFKSLEVDSKTKIIGRYPQYDKSRTYEKYNFIIEDSIKIVDFINNLKLGNEVRNSTEDPSFKLTIVKNYEEIGSWTINPTLKSAMTHDGHTYEFNIDQIAMLNKQFPFTYFHEIKVFSSKDEYEKYLTLQKGNPNFLFDYAPQFKYEGSFEIEFPKNSKFPHPKAISEFLEPYIEKIVNKDDYTLAYVLNSKNMMNRDQYTMTIQGSKKLYENLKLDNLKKENWQLTVEDAYFFYRR